MKTHRYGRYEVQAFARPIEGTSPIQYTGYVAVFDVHALAAGPIAKGELEAGSGIKKSFATVGEAESTAHALGWTTFVRFRQRYTEGPVPDFVFVIDKAEESSVVYEATRTYPLKFPQIKVQVKSLDRSNQEIADHLAKAENLTIDVEDFETAWVGEGRYVRFYRSREGKVVAVEDGERTIAILRTGVL